MDAMECKTAGLSFFQKLRRFTNMQPQHLSLLSSFTHLSSQLTYWIISEPIRELLHVSCQWQNLQDLKKVWDLAMDRVETLAQVIWPCFAWLVHNQASIFQRAGSSIPMSKCSCLAYAIDVLNAWFFYRWLFRTTLVADGNFTADHMKMRCLRKM